MKGKIAEYIFLTLGTFFVAFSVTVCLAPVKLSTGGVSGIGTILLYRISVPLSVTNIIANIVLFTLGFKLLSKSAVVKTVLGTIFLTLFLEVCTHIPSFSDDVLVSALSGGVILGLGLGMVIRSGGSTGGTDLAGILLHKKIPHITVSNHILIIDLVTIALMAFVFGSINVAAYSAIALFSAIKVCEGVLSYGNAAKEIRIVSKNAESIAKQILTQFNRGVTGIQCRGMYTGRESLLIFCIISPRQLPGIIRFIKSHDKEAFVSVSDVREVLGKGFQGRE